MKVRPISAVVPLVLGVALMTGGFVHAIDEAAPRSRAHSADATTQRRVALRLQTLADKLELSADQKLALRPILESEANALRALRLNTSITPEEQEAEMGSIHARHREQIRAVLTPEQQARLDELRSQARAKLSEPDGQKRKGRVPVMPDTD